MSYVLWNMVFVFTFTASLILTLVIPLFVVGFLLLILAYLIPLLVYVLIRNNSLEKDEWVLTPSHIQRTLSGQQRAHRGGTGKDRDIPEDRGPPIGLLAMGGANELTNKANLLGAKQSPGFIPAREVLHDALKRRAEKIVLDYTCDSVSVRMEIDGVWHELGLRDRESGDLILAVLKKISALNVEDRKRASVLLCGSMSNKRRHSISVSWDYGRNCKRFFNRCFKKRRG